VWRVVTLEIATDGRHPMTTPHDHVVDNTPKSVIVICGYAPEFQKWRTISQVTVILEG